MPLSAANLSRPRCRIRAAAADDNVAVAVLGGRADFPWRSFVFCDHAARVPFVLCSFDFYYCGDDGEDDHVDSPGEFMGAAAVSDALTGEPNPI